ncbi:hypothetical protein [Actinokineospora sp. NPDC004072]
MGWALGGSAVTALAHPGLHWAPGPLVVVSVVLNLLVMRILDDLRDLDHDRVHNPGRPLARGLVSVRDVAWLAAVCSALIVAFTPLLAVQLAYAAAVFAVDRFARWPAGEAVLTGLVIALPVQLLLTGALYAGVLDGAAPTWRGVLACAVPTLAMLHLEFARKTARGGGARTYVPVLGFGGSAAAAALAALAAVALAAVLTGSPLPLLAAAVPALAVARLRQRWPLGLAGLFPLLLFGVLVLEGLISS